MKNNSANKYLARLKSVCRKRKNQAEFDLTLEKEAYSALEINDPGTAAIRCQFHNVSKVFDGLSALLEKDVRKGWTRLHHAADEWLYCLYFFESNKDDYRLPGLEYYVWTLNLSMCLGHWDRARWLIKCIEPKIAEPLELFRGGSGLMPWEASCCALVRVRGGEPATSFASRSDLGPYRKVFAAWQDTATLKSVLPKICDYHLQQVIRSGSQRVDEVSGVFDSIGWPLELIAIWRVREELGLEMPKFDHPLTDNNPLYHLPPDTSRASHPLLDLLEKHLVSLKQMEKEFAKIELGQMPPPGGKPTVSLEQFEKWILENSDNSIQEAVTCQYAVGLEHRESASDLLQYVQEALGRDDDYNYLFEFMKKKGGILSLKYKGRELEEKFGRLSFPFSSVMSFVAELLAPELIVKGFRDTAESDTQFYAFLPVEWYNDFYRRHPQRCEEAFAELEEMK